MGGMFIIYAIVFLGGIFLYSLDNPSGCLGREVKKGTLFLCKSLTISMVIMRVSGHKVEKLGLDCSGCIVVDGPILLDETHIYIAMTSFLFVLVMDWVIRAASIVWWNQEGDDV